MARLEVSIPSASTAASAAKPFTIYEISIRQPLRSYTLTKRYSDFTTLHDTLISQTNATPPAPLPPKSWLKSTVSDAGLTEERRQGLERYLKAIVEASDSRWRNCTAWKTFLNLPSNANGGKGPQASSTGRITGLSATITDPSVWLDVHRDLKTQLRDARQALTRRDQSASPQTQHEASAEVKSCLVRAGAMFSALEGGLSSMGAGNAKASTDVAASPKLGEGEIRRRKDLLASARKDRDHVEEVMLSHAGRQVRPDGSDGAEASPSDKDNLFNGPSGSNTGSTSRRIIGAPKETERTRPLDNDGVLQLQQQVLQEQDQDVSVLTRTVQRMRDMGVQINDELQLQNEMLVMLDKDVDRVGDKVNVAKKRIGKIS